MILVSTLVMDSRFINFTSHDILEVKEKIGSRFLYVVFTNVLMLQLSYFVVIRDI